MGIHIMPWTCMRILVCGAPSSFSFLIGALFRMLEKSRDLVLMSMGYLLAAKLMNRSISGLFLSASFIYLVVHVLFFRFKYNGLYDR